MAEPGRTHLRRPGTVDAGRDYEDGLSALVLLRALRHWPSAEMSTNVEEAGAFDDVVLLLPPLGALLVQLKHKGDNFYVSSNLLKGNKDFGLLRYLDSFRALWTKGSLWSDFNMDRSSAKFILYTNAKVSCDPGPPVEKELLDLLSTGTPGKAYYLDPASHSYINGELSTEFFERFIIFCEQTHASYLPCLVQQEVALYSGIVPGLWNATQKYCRIVQRKNRAKGKIPFLHARTDCYEALLASVSKETRLPSGVLLNESASTVNGGKVKKGFSESHAVTLVLAGSSSLLRSSIAVQCVRAYSCAPVILANAENVYDSVEMWLRAPSTLVLDEVGLSEEDVEELSCTLSPELSDEQRLVLLAQEPNGALSRALATTTVEINGYLADLHEQCRITLLSTNVQLQGAEKPIPLSSLAPESVWPRLGADSVSLLLRPGPPIPLGTVLQSPPPHYLQRRFRIMIPIQMDVVRDLTVRDVFLFEGMDVNELKRTAPNKLVGDFTQLDSDSRLQCVACNEYSPLRMKQIKTTTTEPVHFVRRSGNSMYVIDNAGGLESVLRYLDPKDAEQIESLGKLKLCEDDLLMRDLRLVSVSSDPGMGKTSFLLESARRVKEKYPHWWVFLLIMNKLCKLLARMKSKTLGTEDVQSLLEAAAEISPQSRLASELARTAAWDTGMCAVLIDGFDEIAPDYVEAAKAAIGVLVRSPVKLLWVTTRPVTGEKVREELNVTAFDLDPLTEGEQVNLMANLSGRSDYGMARRINSILESFKSSTHFSYIIPITGSPLIVRLLAELACPRENEADLFEDENARINLFDLYNAMLKRTFNLFLEEKQKKDLTLPAIKGEMVLLWKQALDKHCLCALSILLSSEDFQSISTGENFLRVLEEIREGEERIGLLVEVMGEQPRFVHRTIAEFFAAKWMSENWRDHHEVVRRVYNDRRLDIVRYFLDEFFVEDFPFHRQILRGPSKKPDERFALKHLNEKDKGGRTPLHITAIADDDRMLEYLVKLGANLEEIDELCGTTPLYYAEGLREWNTVRILVDLGAVVRNNFSDHPFTKELKAAGVPVLWRAFEANWPVFMFARDIFTPKEIRTVLFPANVVGHEECVLWFRKKYGLDSKDARHLMKRFPYLDGLEKKGNNENTPPSNTEFLKAVLGGTLFDVKRMLGLGADIRTCDPLGDTALHIAARSGKSVIVADLARRGADLKARNSRNQTPEMTALEESHDDTVELLRYLDSSEPKESAFMAGLGLLEAAKQGDVERVREFLRVGASTIVGRYPDGSRALHEAVQNSHVEVVALLCRSGVECGMPDGAGSTPLHFAAERGSAAIVGFLIENGADVGVRDGSYYTPLHLAAKAGHAEAVRMLVRSGADVEATGQDNNRPLHLAAEGGHVEVLRELLKSGSSVDAQTFMERTPLHVAAWKGHCGAIDVLMNAGACSSLQDNFRGETPLHMCVEHGHARAALLLIKREPGLMKLPDKYGKTAFNGASQISRNMLVREILHTLESIESESEILFENILDLMIVATEGSVDNMRDLLNKQGESRLSSEYFQKAFLVAAGSGNVEVVNVLLEAGIDRNTVNEDGLNALHFAAAQGQVAVIKLLLEHGADCNAEGADEISPLVIAIDDKHEGAAIALLEGGAKFEVQTEPSGSLLWRAAESGLSGVVEKLLDMGADCNALDVEEPEPDAWRERDERNEPCGVSALAVAADNGHVDVVSLLLARGARVDIADRLGRTALLGAYRIGHKECAELLVKAGADERVRDSAGVSPRDATFRAGTEPCP